MTGVCVYMTGVYVYMAGMYVCVRERLVCGRVCQNVEINTKPLMYLLLLQVTVHT